MVSFYQRVYLVASVLLLLLLLSLLLLFSHSFISSQFTIIYNYMVYTAFKQLQRSFAVFMFISFLQFTFSLNIKNEKRDKMKTKNDYLNSIKIKWQRMLCTSLNWCNCDIYSRMRWVMSAENTWELCCCCCCFSINKGLPLGSIEDKVSFFYFVSNLDNYLLTN